MIILSLGGGHVACGRLAAGEGDEAIEDWGKGTDRRRRGEAAELRVAGVMTLPATASTYSDTGSDAIT